MHQQAYDILIVGGGVIGSSIAYHLLKDELDGTVAVLEKDPSYIQTNRVLFLSVENSLDRVSGDVGGVFTVYSAHSLSIFRSSLFKLLHPFK